MTFNDPDFIERCHAYWDGLTPPEDADALLAEVAKDPAKLAWFGAMERGFKRLAQSMEQPLPEALEARLEAAVSTEVARAESSRLAAKSPKPKFPWPAAVASVLLLAVVGFAAPRMWHWALYVPGEPLPGEGPSKTLGAVSTGAMSDAELEAEIADAWASVDEMEAEEAQLAEALPGGF